MTPCNADPTPPDICDPLGAESPIAHVWRMPAANTSHASTPDPRPYTNDGQISSRHDRRECRDTTPIRNGSQESDPDRDRPRTPCFERARNPGETGNRDSAKGQASRRTGPGECTRRRRVSAFYVGRAGPASSTRVSVHRWRLAAGSRTPAVAAAMSARGQPTWSARRRRTGLRIARLWPILSVVSGYGVYVIELKTRAAKDSICSLYVGSSFLEASARRRQHHEGYPTGAQGLDGQTRRLRPELYADLPWKPDRTEAVELERQRARRLSDAGFHVRCDGRTYVRSPREWRPFTGGELMRVEHWFEQHLRGLLSTCQSGTLTIDDAVRLLRWRSGDPSGL